MKVTASWSQWFDTGARVAGGGVTIRVPERRAFKTVGHSVLPGGSLEHPANESSLGKMQVMQLSNLVDDAIPILIIITQRF